MYDYNYNIKHLSSISSSLTPTAAYAQTADNTPPTIESANAVASLNEYKIKIDGPLDNTTRALRDIQIDNNGTVMFVLDGGTSTIYQFEFGVPYDVGTLSYSGKSIRLTQSNSFRGLTLSQDGTQLYAVAFNPGTFRPGTAYQYSLSTPFEIDTATFLYSVGYRGTPSDIALIEDGTILYVTFSSSNTIVRSPFGIGPPGSAPFDIRQATDVLGNFDDYRVAGIHVNNFALSEDATRFYFAHTNGDVRQFVHPNPTPIRPGGADNVFRFSERNLINLPDTFTQLRGISIADNGNFLYVLDDATDTIYGYTLFASHNVTHSDPKKAIPYIQLHADENIINENADPADFTVSGIASNPTPHIIHASEDTIILYLNNTIVSTDLSPTLSYTQSSGTITDLSTNQLADFGPLQVTFIPPAVDILSITGNNGSSVTSQTIEFTIIFSEQVMGFEESDITIGGTAGVVLIDSGTFDGSGTTYTFNVSSLAQDGTIEVQVPADVAQSVSLDKGNAESPIFNITVDTIRPEPIITSPVVSSGTTTATTTLSFEITFPEPVDTPLVQSDITISSAIGIDSSDIINFVNVNPEINDTYTFGLTDITTDGTIMIDISENVTQDAAGNNNTATQFSFTVDTATLTPVLTASPINENGSATNQDTITYTINFGGDVTGFEQSDIIISGTANGTTPEIADFTEQTATSVYTFTVSRGTSDGYVTIDIDAGAASTSTTNVDTNELDAPRTLFFDTMAPVPVITSTISLGETTYMTTLSFEITFSKPIFSPLAQSDITLSSTENSVDQSNIDNFVNVNRDTNDVYTFDLTGLTDDTIMIDISENIVRDEAGNGNTAAAQFSFTVDTTMLMPTLTASPINENGSVTNQDTITYTIDFEDDVTGFEQSDILISGTANDTMPTITAFTEQTATSVYTFTVSRGTSDGYVTINIPAGVATVTSNGVDTNKLDAPRTLFFDMMSPEPTIASTTISSGTRTPMTTLSFEITFPEPISSPLAQSDITLSSTENSVDQSNIDNFVNVNPATNDTYTFDLTGLTDDTIMIDIPEDVVRDEAGNDNTAAPQFSFTVDTTMLMPTLTASPINENGSVTNEETITYTIDFEDNVTGFTQSDILISGTANDTMPTITAFTEQTPTSVYTFSVSRGTSDGYVTIDIPAGVATVTSNGVDTNKLDAPRTLFFDMMSPEPVITSTISSGTTTPMTELSFEITFSEPVISPLAQSDITLSSTENSVDQSNIDNFVNVNPATNDTYTFDLTGLTNDTITIDISEDTVQDEAGNDNTAAQFSFTVDTTMLMPTLTASPITNNGSATNQETIMYTVDFGGDVTGFTQSDILISGTANDTMPTITAFTEQTPTSVYTFSVSRGTSDGYVTIDIPAGSATVSINNADVAALSYPRTLFFDTVPPEPTIASSTIPHNGVTSTLTHSFTITFSEPMASPLVTNNINLTGIPGVDSSNIDRFVNVNPTTNDAYTFDLTDLTTDGTLTINIPIDVIQDTAGNDNIISNSYSFTIDTTMLMPTLTASPITDNGSATNQETIMYTIDFGGDVTGFLQSAILISGTANDTTPTITAFTEQTPTSVYTFSVSRGTSDGYVTIDIPAGSANGSINNANTTALSSPRTLFFDTVHPETTITSTISSGMVTPMTALSFEITFSEPIRSPLTTSDITLSSTTGVDQSNINNFVNLNPATNNIYTFDLTGLTDDVIMIDIPADTVQDRASNGNIAATQFSFTVDTTMLMPTLTASPITDNGSVTNQETITYTVDFDGDVTGFTQNDILISGTANNSTLTINNFTEQTPTSVYTFTVSRGTSDGYVTIDILAGVATVTSNRVDTNALDSPRTLFFDATPPKPIITSTLVNSGSTTSLTHIPFEIDFGEVVQGFSAENITFSGTTGVDSSNIENFTNVGNNSVTYIFNITSINPVGSLIMDVAQNITQDIAGNNNTASDTYTLNFIKLTPRESSSNSGGGSHSVPPRITSTSSKPSGSAITINNEPIKLSPNGLSAQLSSPITSTVGKTISLTLNLQDPDGPSQVKHIAVYFNIPDEYPRDYWASDTYLVYEKFAPSPFTIRDNDNNLQSATYNIQDMPDDDIQKFTFTLTFAKPIPNTGIAIHTWDTHNSASLLTISDALKITPKPIVSDDPQIQPSTDNHDDDSQQPSDIQPSVDSDDNDNDNNDNTEKTTKTQSSTDHTRTNPEYLSTVRQWAGFDTKIATDKDILYSLNILESDDDASSNNDATAVLLPDWTKKYLGEWAISGTISYDEFVDVISYVYEKTNNI